jgi:geranylgeranyl reductase family protein
MEQTNIYDLIIVGGGPAGTSAAMRARDYGLNTLVIDKKKFPRDKTCGDALSGKTVDILRKLSLLDKITALPTFTSKSVVFGAPNGKEISIRFRHKDPDKESYGFIVRRRYFDNFLLEEAKKRGAVVKENTVFTALIKDEITGAAAGIKTIVSGKEEVYYAPLIIGADGFGSKVAKEINSRTSSSKYLMAATRSYYKGVEGMSDAIELYFMDDLKYGYFWIFPMTDGYANVGLGMRKDHLGERIETLVQLQEQVINSPRFRNRFKNAELEGKISGWTLPTGNTWRKIYDGGVMLAGDAAGLIDPFTGEGIGNAMTSGYLAGEMAYKAATAARYDKNYLKEYEIKLKKKLAHELYLSTKLQQVSGYHFLLNLVIGKAADNEELRELISGMVANENNKEILRSPLFYLRLLFK